MILKEEIQSAVKEILSERQFTRHYGKSLKEQVLEFIYDILAKLNIKPSIASTHIPEFVSLLLKSLIVLGVGFLLWFIYKNISRSVVSHLETHPNFHKISTPITQADWEQEAERLCKEGCYAEAINAIIHALLFALAKQGGIGAAPGTTNREYLNILEITSRHSLLQAAAQLVHLHEEKSYALKSCNLEDFHRSLTLYKACKLNLTS